MLTEGTSLVTSGRKTVSNTHTHARTYTHTHTHAHTHAHTVLLHLHKWEVDYSVMEGSWGYCRDYSIRKYRNISSIISEMVTTVRYNIGELIDNSEAELIKCYDGGPPSFRTLQSRWEFSVECGADQRWPHSSHHGRETASARCVCVCVRVCVSF